MNWTTLFISFSLSTALFVNLPLLRPPIVLPSFLPSLSLSYLSPHTPSYSRPLFLPISSHPSLNPSYQSSMFSSLPFVHPFTFHISTTYNPPPTLLSQLKHPLISSSAILLEDFFITQMCPSLFLISSLFLLLLFFFFLLSFFP